MSWQKKGSEYPLTVSTHSFFNNGRYLVERYRGVEWNLIILRVENTDKGTYVCKVTSRTMIMAREVYLNVIGKNLIMKKV